MTPTRLPIPNPQVLFTEIDDGSGVLLHLDTKFYFTLNATGVVVWKALTEGTEATDAAGIARLITRDFSVSLETAERDVAAALEQLEADGLVKPR